MKRAEVVTTLTPRRLGWSWKVELRTGNHITEFGSGRALTRKRARTFAGLCERRARWEIDLRGRIR